MKIVIVQFLRYHLGGINILFHTLGIGLLIFSIYIQSTTLFILSFVIEELGHVYNYHLNKKYKGKDGFHPLKNLVNQSILVLPIAIILYVVFF